MSGIIVNNIANEQQFATYLARRGELRDCLRHGVYPNLARVLALYRAFLADFAPGGPLHDPELWAYYLRNIEPIAAYQDAMIESTANIVDIMAAIERATPGTLGIENLDRREEATPALVGDGISEHG